MSKQQNKINPFVYGITRFASAILARSLFRRKFVRNEVKGKKGPMVIIANHECALDFVNLVGITNRKIHFVISNSFYNTLPVRNLLKRAGVIPKQQFQTSVSDLKIMKSVINDGEILLIFPAGLMCEDGLSTPIPTATYKFLKWLDADVYVARTTGSYFVMPKWGKGFRRGKTLVDVYSLLSKEQLRDMSEAEIKGVTDSALLFDCYREQEKLNFPYKRGSNIEGLENVVYKCPCCNTEHSIAVRNKSEIYCKSCGFSQKADKYGFFRKTSEVGNEIRYLSDWSRLIYDDVKRQIVTGELTELQLDVRLSTIDYAKKKFVPVGEGTVRVTKSHFYLSGVISGEPIDKAISIKPFASVPFSPGKHFELQDGDKIYRCLPIGGKEVMKLVNVVKAFYELDNQSPGGKGE